MPTLGLEFLHIYLAEGEQELGKDEPWGDEGHECVHHRFGRSKKRQLGKHQVSQGTGKHGQRKGPVSDEIKHLLIYSNFIDLAG